MVWWERREASSKPYEYLLSTPLCCETSRTMSELYVLSANNLLVHKIMGLSTIRSTNRVNPIDVVFGKFAFVRIVDVSHSTPTPQTKPVTLVRVSAHHHHKPHYHHRHPIVSHRIKQDNNTFLSHNKMSIFHIHGLISGERK